MINDDDSRGWVINGKERNDTYFEDNNPREWNIKIGMKSQLLNVM